MSIAHAPNLTLLAASLALAGTTVAFAATPIDETRPLDPTGRIEIENLKGRIDVQAWDRPEVRIEGSLGKGVEKLEIDGDRSHLSVRVKYPNRGGMGFLSGDNTEPTTLRLMVPLRAELEIDSVSADIDVRGVAPLEMSIDSVSGDIAVVGAPVEASIDSVSGDLRLTLNSANVDVESVSGDVDLRGRLDGEVSVETVSGRIDITGHQSSVQALSGSSVSGDMRITTALAAGGEISLEAVSGDFELRLPGNLSANVRGESFSGDLDVQGAQVDHARHGPGSTVRHRYGSGNGEISLETFSGDARLQLD